MVSKVTSGYSRHDEITMCRGGVLSVDTFLTNDTIGVNMSTSIAITNKNGAIVLTQVFDKLIPMEDFKRLETPYTISEDGVVFEYNNHVVQYSEHGSLLTIEERDTRTDVVVSIITLNLMGDQHDD